MALLCILATTLKVQPQRPPSWQSKLDKPTPVVACSAQRSSHREALAPSYVSWDASGLRHWQSDALAELARSGGICSVSVRSLFGLCILLGHHIVRRPRTPAILGHGTDLLEEHRIQHLQEHNIVAVKTWTRPCRCIEARQISDDFDRGAVGKRVVRLKYCREPADVVRQL